MMTESIMLPILFSVFSDLALVVVWLSSWLVLGLVPDLTAACHVEGLLFSWGPLGFQPWDDFHDQRGFHEAMIL